LVRKLHGGARRFIMKKTVTLLFVLICLALGVRANAQSSEQKIPITLSTPLEVPGRKALPAGEYVFKREMTSGHPIVQILNKDETQVLDTVIAVPADLKKPPENSILALFETQPGDPPALRALFFRDDAVGIEFVYPAVRATTLAKQSGQNVMAAKNPTSPDPSVQPTPEQLAAMKEEMVIVITPDGQTISISEVSKSTPGEPHNEH
jgi:hypothetical protein